MFHLPKCIYLLVNSISKRNPWEINYYLYNISIHQISYLYIWKKNLMLSGFWISCFSFTYSAITPYVHIWRTFFRNERDLFQGIIMLENIIILYPTKDICSIKNMLHAVLCVRKWVLIYHVLCKRWYMVLWKKYFQNTILLSLCVSLWENRWGPEEITGNALLSPSTLCPLDRICKQPWNSLLFFRFAGLCVL